MNPIFALLLATTLTAENPAPAPVAAAPAAVVSHAESAEPVPTPGATRAEAAEPVPAPPEKSAESAGAAEPVPAPVEKHAESAEAAEPVPAPAEKPAKPAETAEPVPAPAGKRAKPVKVNCVNRDNPANGVTGVNCANQTRPPCRVLRGAPCLAKPPVCPAACANRANRANGANPEKPRLGATVRLSDGSVLKGTLRRRFLPADTDALGRLRIDLCAVESIAFLPTSGDNPAGLDRQDRLDRRGPQAAQVQQVQSVQPVRDCRITFRNGDRLTVRFPADLKPLRFDTVLGPVPLPLSAVSKLVLEPPNHLTTQPPNLLYHCTFDDAASIEHPAKGPNGKALGGEFVPGKNGKALRVEADRPAFESLLPKGFLGPEGCLEFWAKIEGDDPRYVDGGDPLFVSLYNERGAITLLQFAANNGFARGGLGGAFVSWPFGTIPHYAGSMEYRKVLGDNWADWHHYAMSWKAGGFGDGSFVKVFVDGRPQPVLGGVDDDKVPARLADYVNHAHDLGIPWSTARAADRRRSKKPFLVDDLKIWSVAKTEFATSTPSAEPRLLYHCTFDDAQSIEHPAAGPAGKFLGGEFVPGKVGNALFVKAGTHAAEVPFPTGLMQTQGCIEFWGKIPGAMKETTYPDGGNPTFFAMGVGKYVNTFVKYTANDGFGTGGLHADLPGSAYVSSDSSTGFGHYPDFLGAPAAWHHYALIWSDKGLDAASEALGRRVVSALYVDGKLMNPAYGTNGPDRAKFFREFVENSVVLGFPIVPGRQDFAQNRVDFMIDDFKIWNFPKTDFGISTPSAEPRLIYHCTFEDATAIEHPATGPKSTFLGGDFVAGKVGGALRVRKGVSSAIVPFEKGTIQSRGTIEFWAKIENDRETFGDGGDPRFFLMETAPGTETVFQLAANDGFGRGGLSIYHQGISMSSEDHCLGPAHYESVLPGTTKDWHHYALVWDENGIPGLEGSVALAAFIDGKRIPLHGDTGLAKAPRMAAYIRNNPATLFFSLNPGRGHAFSNKSDFLIDEFKIWSAPVVPIAASHGA